MKGPVPVATTVNVALPPAHTFTFCGGVVICVDGLTVIVNGCDVPVQVTPFKV